MALLVWLMIIPMPLKIDFSALHKVGRHWRGIGVILFGNWAVKPFSMALLGLASIVVPWATPLLSVVLYIVLPVLGAQMWRRTLLARGGQASLDATLGLSLIHISEPTRPSKSSRMPSSA